MAGEDVHGFRVKSERLDGQDAIATHQPFIKEEIQEHKQRPQDLLPEATVEYDNAQNYRRRKREKCQKMIEEIDAGKKKEYSRLKGEVAELDKQYVQLLQENGSLKKQIEILKSQNGAPWESKIYQELSKLNMNMKVRFAVYNFLLKERQEAVAFNGVAEEDRLDYVLYLVRTFNLQ